MKKQIFLIGAGKSAQSLIHYLVNNVLGEEFQLVVGDIKSARVKDATKELKNVSVIQIDVSEKEKLAAHIYQSVLVISMVPTGLHYPIAKICVKLQKSLLTASYPSSAIHNLDQEARSRGVLLMTECGLDPGIDHMSAMREIHAIRKIGGEITSFKSYTGGLVAPESDDNPWGYKITWNPKNVVLAGSEGVKFIRDNKYKYIPYHNLFKRTEKVVVNGYGEFEAYPNRNSLDYQKIYTLENVATILRGTLRKKGFCEAWDVLVQLGYTNDTVMIDNLTKLNLREVTNSFLPFHKSFTVEQKLQKRFELNPSVMERLTYLGIFDNTSLPHSLASAADVLLFLITTKWKLQEEDKDMVVMQHQFEYTIGSEKFQKKSSLIIKGRNKSKTAMANTVGLPMGIMAKLILEGKIKQTGICRPVYPEMYTAILNELENYNIKFTKKILRLHSHNPSLRED